MWVIASVLAWPALVRGARVFPEGGGVTRQAVQLLGRGWSGGVWPRHNSRVGEEHLPGLDHLFEGSQRFRDLLARFLAQEFQEGRAELSARGRVA